MKKVVILLSGGVDSVTAIYWALATHDVAACLSFDYGAKHNHKEIPYARYHCEKEGIRHDVVNLDFVNRLFKSDLLQSGGDIPEGHYEALSMSQTIVPFRNGIMLAVAAGYAESIGASGVVIAAHSGDHAIYPDCREDFMCPMANAIKYGTEAGVEIIRPFIEMNKTQIVSLGISLGVDYAQTWSCYKGGSTHCGKCGTCTERTEAFAIAGIPYPHPTP